jgi:hypothetical protein
MRRALLLLTLPLAVACSGGSDLGEAAGKAGGDTQLVKDAQAAVNAVVRNAADCSAARAAWPEAQRKLDAADKAVQTPTGQTTLSMLRKQAKNIIDNCPG